MANKWTPNVGWMQSGWAKEASVTSLPELVTLPASSILDTTATSGGLVTFAGGGTVSTRGVCWSTTIYPKVTDSHTTDGTGLGTFSSSMTGLSASTTYHVRAYATNAAGTSYGPDLTLVTLAPQYVTHDLLAHYKFDTGSGTTLHDSTVNALDFTFPGGSANPTWTARGLTFAVANSQYVSRANGLNITSDMTVMLVFKTSKVTWQVILGMQYLDAGYPGFEIATSGNVAGDFDYSGNLSSGAYSTSTAYCGGSWVCATVTISNTNVAFYNNTATAGTATSTRPNSYAGLNVIGGRSNLAIQFDGEIGYILIYTAALTPTEITTNYNYLKGVMATRGVTLP